MSLFFYKKLSKFINKKSKSYSIQKIPGLNAITRELNFIYRYYLNTPGGPLQLVVVLVSKFVKICVVSLSKYFTIYMIFQLFSFIKIINKIFILFYW